MGMAYTINHKGGKKCVDNGGGFMGEGRITLRFLKNVPMICVNLIIIVIVIPEKRKVITFVQCSCTIEMLSLCHK